MPATDTPPKSKAPKLIVADAPRVLAGILELLGLPGDSDEAAILERIDALVQGTIPATARQAAPDPRAFVPASAVQEMVKERRTERLALAAEQAKTKVNDALRQGYITPALKGWALALCEADPASFDAFLATSGPVFAYLFKETHTAGAPPARHEPMADSHAAAAICSQLGLKPDALNSTSP